MHSADLLVDGEEPDALKLRVEVGHDADIVPAVFIVSMRHRVVSQEMFCNHDTLFLLMDIRRDIFDCCGNDLVRNTAFRVLYDRIVCCVLWSSNRVTYIGTGNLVTLIFH